MYNIDNATAATIEPAPGAVGPKPNGFFTGGNAGAGVAATIVDADWLNAVQGELSAAIEGGGLTLSKTNSGQLATVLANLKATFIHAQNGPSSGTTISTSVSLMPAANCNVQLTGGTSGSSNISTLAVSVSAGTLVSEYSFGSAANGSNAGISAVISLAAGVPTTITLTTVYTASSTGNTVGFVGLVEPS
jgi:hypothetical protein